MTPVEQKLASQMGELMITNAKQATGIEQLAAKVQELTIKNNELTMQLHDAVERLKEPSLPLVTIDVVGAGGGGGGNGITGSGGNGVKH